MTNIQKYTKSTIILHWIQGVLILFILATGTLVLSEMPNTIEKLSSFKIHMILGLIITILTVIRIINIIKSQKPQALEVSAFRQKLITFNHISIYVVLLLIGISGILLSKGSGLGEMIFFGIDTQLYDSFKDYSMGVAHGILTKVLLFLIIMHLAGIISDKMKTKINPVKRMCLKDTKCSL